MDFEFDMKILNFCLLILIFSSSNLGMAEGSVSLECDMMLMQAQAVRDDVGVRIEYGEENPIEDSKQSLAYHDLDDESSQKIFLDIVYESILAGDAPEQTKEAILSHCEGL